MVHMESLVAVFTGPRHSWGRGVRGWKLHLNRTRNVPGL